MHHSWVFSRSLICISLTVLYGKSVKTMTHSFNANVKFTFWHFNDPYSTNAANYFEIRYIMEGKHNQNIWKQSQIVTYFWWIYFITIVLGVNHRSSVNSWPKCQQCWALMFALLLRLTNCWTEIHTRVDEDLIHCICNILANIWHRVHLHSWWCPVILALCVRKPFFTGEFHLQRAGHEEFWCLFCCKPYLAVK